MPARGSYRHCRLGIAGDRIPNGKHLEQRGQALHAALRARARHHQIARLSNWSPQYFPFICTIWSTHCIPWAMGCLKEFTSVAHREIMQGHPLQRGKGLLFLVTPRFPSKYKHNPVCHQQSCVSPSPGKHTTFEEKKKESDPQIFAMAGLHFAF